MLPARLFGIANKAPSDKRCPTQLSYFKISTVLSSEGKNFFVLIVSYLGQYQGLAKTVVTEIQYPVAYARPYETVHIEDAQRGRPYFCFGCDREMVMRRGDIRRPHFAHKVGFVQCEKDNTLHEAAKAFIRQGFLHAVATGAEYQVQYPCKQCEAHISVNVAIQGANIESEKTVVKGTRSDLVIFRPDGSPRVIIEIVVTHDLESDTKQRYEETDYPVVTVKPSWDILRDLRRAAIGSRILNIKGDKHRYCNDCRNIQKKEAAARAEEAEIYRRIEQVNGRGPRSPHKPLTPLTEEELMRIPSYAKAKAQTQVSEPS